MNVVLFLFNIVFGRRVCEQVWQAAAAAAASQPCHAALRSGRLGDIRAAVIGVE